MALNSFVNERWNVFMKRLFCLILCLCFGFSMAACSSSNRSWDSMFSDESDSWKPTVDNDWNTLAEDDDTPRIVSRPDSSRIPFEYELTESDIEEFYALLEESEKICLEGTDLDLADEISTQVADYLDYLEDQAVIAQIIYYADQSDEEASQRYLDCTEILADTNNDYIESIRRVYRSDSPAKEVLFEDWTQKELDMLLSYSEEVAALEKRNAEILVEYQALDDPASDDMIPLYLEQVSNNNRIAQIYGYENYYEYAFEMVYDRDYAPAQLEDMRQYVAQYISDDYDDALELLMEAMDEMTFIEQMQFSGFETKDFDAVSKDYVGLYLEGLPQQMKEGMADAFKDGNSYYTDLPDAHDGAFTTVVGDQSFCFFGPGYANCLTVVHEIGHYYGSQFADMDAMSYDLAETQSQGNEWLFMSVLSEHMDRELYNTLVSYKMYNDLAVILICVLVDEFEQRIYAVEDPTSLTAEDCNAIMEEVCSHYGGVDYISTYTADIQQYWRMVVVESPVYYISYGVSAIAAMNLYTLYQEDAEAAIAAYRVITEQDWEGEGFLAALEAAGLPGPFDESVYEALDAIYE